MNKYEQINDILLFFKQLVEENPNIDLTQPEYKYVSYKSITRLGVPESERLLDISKLNYFDAWINKFEDIPNINCFTEAEWPYFCQFVNEQEIQRDYIKMYIPLDFNHLYNGANMIFEFLANNKIIHQSKIGKNIRFDDIVIRLTNKEDANLLADFVKNNKYIQEGLIKENPFSFSKDGITYACDGRISYNSTVCQFINMYTMSKKSNLDSISVSDFYGYILNYYKIVFEEPCNIDKFINDFNIDKDIASYIFQNYKQVVALILKSSDPNFTYDDFINHFEACNNNLDIDYLNINKIDNTIDDRQLEDLFCETITKMSIKYGKNNALTAFNDYLKDGNSTNITRLDNLRDRVVNSNLRKYVTNILQTKNIYLEQYYNQLKLMQTEKIDKEQITINAIIETFNKYKESNPDQACEIKNQLAISLKRALFEHSYSGFTRQNNARKNMLDNISTNDLLSILVKYYGLKDSKLTQNQLEQFCTTYVENVIDLHCEKTY